MIIARIEAIYQPTLLLVCCVLPVLCLAFLLARARWAEVGQGQRRLSQTMRGVIAIWSGVLAVGMTVLFLRFQFDPLYQQAIYNEDIYNQFNLLLEIAAILALATVVATVMTVVLARKN